MTSQAVYCLSLQIRPPAEEGSNVVASSSSISVTGNELTKVVTTSAPTTAPGGAIITGLDSKNVSLSEATSRQIQFHSVQPSNQMATQPQHSNIILVRGSRSENGQIILQNTHELLSLLSDEDKPILLQHQRLKAKAAPEVTTATNAGNTILFQPAIKSNAVDGTILLQSSDGIKKTAIGQEGGPIFLQQRLNKNGSTDGPILLRTLKRIDKSQSILVIRNATTTASASAAIANATSTSSASVVANAATSVVNVNAAALANSCKASIVKASALQTQHQQQSKSGAATVIEEVELKKEPVATTVSKVIHKSINMPLGTDGEPIKLPENLESLPRADHFPTQRHRWNTNEEIAAILISFDKHSEWQSKEVKTRPKSGSMLLYSRKKVRYRRDGYCWKKRKDGKTTREDHMKLKVQGTECIYGCYVHSAILPTFHRRCYWLLQNPDIVLVHYLNVPYPDDNKMAVITPNLALWGDKKEWTKEELVSQLKPMFFPAVFSEDEPDATNEIEISTAETVEAIVSQLMEKQRMARQSALVKQLECGCPDANCVDGKSCSHPMRRISAAKSDLGKRSDGGQLGGTAPNVLIGSRMYPRWIDSRRAREQQQQQQQQHQQQLQQSHSSLLDGSRAATSKDTSLHFQVIPTSQQPNHSNNHPNSIRAIAGNHHQNSSPVVVSSSSNLTLTQHLNSLNSSLSSSGSASNNNNNSQLTSVSSHITNGLANAHLAAAQHHQQQQQQQHRSHMIIASNNSSTAAAATSSSVATVSANNQLTVTHSNNGGGGRDPNINLTANGENHISMLGGGHQQQSSSSSSSAVVTSRTVTTEGVNQRTSGQDGGGGNGNGGGLIGNGNNNSTNDGVGSGHHNHITVNNTAVSSASMSNGSNNGGAGTPSLVLSLSQLQGTPGSLLILNGQQQSFVCHPSQQQQQQHLQQQQQRKNVSSGTNESSGSGSNSTSSSIKMENSPSDASQHSLIPKQEIMDLSSSPSSSFSMMGHHQQGSSSTHSSIESSSKQYESMFGAFSSSARHSPAAGGHGHGMDGNGHHDNLPFFNETLDLSQEDIQKTLSANMPLGHGGQGVGVGGSSETPTDDAMNGEINPMDFIENCGDHHGAVDDDVFVNLDAFDMLVEFPELELDAKSSFLSGSETGTDVGDNGVSDLGQFKLSAGSEIVVENSIRGHHSNTSTITDFSPEWAYPEGGVKVLVTGPWSVSSSYTVLFDSFPVPTTLVQNGVLRCYCPAHEVGVVILQVACDGYVISNAVNFEYKSPPKLETKCEGNENDMLYKFNLLNRLESIDEKLQIKVEPGELPEDSVLFKQVNFEDRLVTYCQMLTAKIWRSVTPGSWLGKHRGMTLLHLASALGYAKLVRTMLTWKSENSNVILEAEIDALSQDQDGYTPLMWACARGHAETAVILYKWNQNALNVKSNTQQSPLELARGKGFAALAAELERHETQRLQNKQSQPKTSSSMLTLASISTSCTTSSTSTSSASSCSSAATVTISGSSNNSFSSSLADNNSSNSTSRASEPANDNSNTSNNNNDNDSNNRSGRAANTSPEHSFINDLFNYNDALNSSNSDSCSNDHFALSSSFNPSLSPAAMSPYGDMKGSCSSMGSGTVSSALTAGNLHYALENNNSNPMLSNALSPNSDSNRSHDGVFLRPGAVFSSGQSPPGARLSKRSSIDSGINMETRSTMSKTGKSLRDAQRLSRTDRSMSLPVGAGGNQSPYGGANAANVSHKGGAAGNTDADNFPLSLNDRTTESPSQISGNISLLSPLRKMDFALCEVSAVETSSMCEDSDSLQEDERHSVANLGHAHGGHGLYQHHQHHHQHHQDSVEMTPGGGNVGDSDAKVLTLAEQIIAAMPERIKNESEEIMSLGSPMQETLSEDASGMSMLNDSFMEPLLDSLPSSQFEEFNFEFSDHSYRYHDVGTPCSSLSPASSGPLQSPASYSIPQDPPSPAPTTQDFTEFLQATNSNPFEKDFSNLKLTDREQRELYEAAKCIQKAYRSYKGRKSRMEEQDKERSAAVVIQNYYRRYKQYAYYRQMTQAAVIIQNGYRSYCENKRFKKSQSNQSSSMGGVGSGESAEEAASSAQCIQNYYRSFKNEHSKSPQQQHNQGSSKEPSPSGPLKRTYSQRTQNQAARKIQQFMRQSKNKLQRERAEKERQVPQPRAESLQSLQYLGAVVPGVQPPISDQK
ncbi:calmodulin-binding transcription activator 1 isoform X3 [Toxorhynchites rutilus septentrionalis]|uniref:calmodulin-binding transcription activator 1 isoform X3 n=1 Tax=Toxorhynchites rutilus septentrionalis TaxID=329112 RepID=UPI00247A3E37|nr:calmodulin-binding transcription activator 1 isoform X3 [Toxorhynchites rutilus septentrionalis]